MLAYILRRLWLGLVTVVAISIVSFVIIQLPPGDFVDAYISNLSASGSMVSQQEAQSLRQQYGLDRPVWVQYGKWMTKVIQGDFGMSMEWGRPVTEVIGDRLWLTESSMRFDQYSLSSLAARLPSRFGFAPGDGGSGMAVSSAVDDVNTSFMGLGSDPDGLR
mgnify:CR=1 FL=1